MDNTGAAPVQGRFAQGTTISLPGYAFEIDYAGGDGNDVVLKLVAAPAWPPCPRWANGACCCWVCWRRGWGRGGCGARDGVPPVGAVVREKVDATE